MRPTILFLKRKVSGCFDGLWGILINPRGQSRSLTTGVCELNANVGIVAVRKVDDALQRFDVRVGPDSLIHEAVQWSELSVTSVWAH